MKPINKSRVALKAYFSKLGWELDKDIALQTGEGKKVIWTLTIPSRRDQNAKNCRTSFFSSDVLWSWWKGRREVQLSAVKQLKNTEAFYLRNSPVGQVGIKAWADGTKAWEDSLARPRPFLTSVQRRQIKTRCKETKGWEAEMLLIQPPEAFLDDDHLFLRGEMKKFIAEQIRAASLGQTSLDETSLSQTSRRVTS